jgi:hypothetical protein
MFYSYQLYVCTYTPDQQRPLYEARATVVVKADTREIADQALMINNSNLFKTNVAVTVESVTVLPNIA